jgi:hypothetical protein
MFFVILNFEKNLSLLLRPSLKVKASLDKKNIDGFT